jgi:hypothetical protein
MRFAQKILKHNNNNADDTNDRRLSDDILHVLVGDPCLSEAVPWELRFLTRPNLTVVDTLLDVYIARAHWFMLFIHAPTVKNRTRILWRRPTWQRTEAGEILVILSIVAMAAVLATEDTSWSGHSTMEEHGINLSTFRDDVLREIDENLLDVMGDCSVESVQICLILARYRAYTGETNIAWTLVGMAARNAYAAGFHLQPSNNDDLVQNEIRRRVWLAVKTVDTFSAMFNGRPPSLDSNFVHRREPYHIDDLAVHPDLVGHPMLQWNGRATNFLTFHDLKYELYEIMGKTLSAFRQIRDDIQSPDNQQLLYRTVRETNEALMSWRARVPPFFDHSTWEDNDPLGYMKAQDQPWADNARMLTLQSLAMQVMFDSLIILLHRPVIELSLQPNASSNLRLTPEDVSWSVQAAVDAALRSSRISMHTMECESSLAYILMNSLTISVILCIPPIQEPMTVRAQQAKEGLYRISSECKQMSAKVPLAEQIHTLLSSLIATVVQRESASVLAQHQQQQQQGAAAAASRSAPATTANTTSSSPQSQSWNPISPLSPGSTNPLSRPGGPPHGLSVRMNNNINNNWHNAAGGPSTGLLNEIISPITALSPARSNANDQSWTTLDLLGLIPGRDSSGMLRE